MKINYITLSILVVLSILTGCEKSTEGISRITYYVTIDLEGSETELVEKGSAYVEPGFTAIEGDEEVTGSVEVTDNIDVNTLGAYIVNYEAVNKDGYTSSISRTVVVYDPTAPDIDLSGTYNTDVVRTESDGSNPRPRSSTIEILKVGPGIFSVNCLLGYYYAAGYGARYEMRGLISLDSESNITELNSYVIGWGDGLEDLLNGKYDPATGDLYWESIYAVADIFAVSSKMAE